MQLSRVLVPSFVVVVALGCTAGEDAAAPSGEPVPSEGTQEADDSPKDVETLGTLCWGTEAPSECLTALPTQEPQQDGALCEYLRESGTNELLALTVGGAEYLNTVCSTNAPVVGEESTIRPIEEGEVPSEQAEWPKLPLDQVLAELDLGSYGSASEAAFADLLEEEVASACEQFRSARTTDYASVARRIAGESSLGSAPFWPSARVLELAVQTECPRHWRHFQPLW